MDCSGRSCFIRDNSSLGSLWSHNCMVFNSTTSYHKKTSQERDICSFILAHDKVLAANWIPIWLMPSAFLALIFLRILHERCSSQVLVVYTSDKRENYTWLQFGFDKVQIYSATGQSLQISFGIYKVEECLTSRSVWEMGSCHWQFQ